MALKLANPNGQENAREIAQVLTDELGVPSGIRTKDYGNIQFYFLEYINIGWVRIHIRKLERIFPNDVTIGVTTFKEDGSFELQIADRRVTNDA